MSREIYTYTNLKELPKMSYMKELIKCPFITVSADLRKSLNGNEEFDKVDGLFSKISGFHTAEFVKFNMAIDDQWNSDQNKFSETIIIAEYIRTRLEQLDNGSKDRNWLIGCQRNISSILSGIALLEQADIKPEDIEVSDDRNLEVFVEAWKRVRAQDKVLAKYKEKLSKLSSKSAWKNVFMSAFKIDNPESVDSIVFHAFYYITPQQEMIMKLLEESGFKIICLFPYDERYPFAYEIWDKTYSVENGYPDKTKWHMDRTSAADAYGDIFEGRRAAITNNLSIKEYASKTEFVNAVRHIKEVGYSLYSADSKSANKMLKDYYPESYGDRKILSYPIGQFISTLNRMWDEDKQSISIDEDRLIECFSSGWLAVDGISGKEYMQDLTYILPFFNGCNTISEWEERLEYFKEIQENVIAPFEVDLDVDETISRWQEAIASPLKNFSMFSVSIERSEIILKLIKQLLDMARQLFGKNEPVHIQDHVRNLYRVLRLHDISKELYTEETEIVSQIFDTLSSSTDFDIKCNPSDIASALDLFITGKFEEGEVLNNKVGLIYPLYFVDAACVKNKGKVHICMSDIESLPGANKEYIWPLSESIMIKTYEKTHNKLIINLMHIMASNTLCNRYFTYCALKNEDVVFSWISSNGEKLLGPSPYITLLRELTDAKYLEPYRYSISRNQINTAMASIGRTEDYENDKAPMGMIKEARMDYALCPMKYLLGYVLEKRPVFQSEFQQNYALNALISSIYNLMKKEGMTVNEVYDRVIELFPNLRKVEKRQVYDYISYDHKEDDMDYGMRSECGGYFYTDERLKINYPNQDVRGDAIVKYGRLYTPDGRRGINLYDRSDVIGEACSFCPHIDYCRNAYYPGDSEDFYD